MNGVRDINVTLWTRSFFCGFYPNVYDTLGERRP